MNEEVHDPNWSLEDEKRRLAQKANIYDLQNEIIELRRAFDEEASKNEELREQTIRILRTIDGLTAGLIVGGAILLVVIILGSVSR